MTAGQPDQARPSQLEGDRRHCSLEPPFPQTPAPGEARGRGQEAKPKRGRRHAFLPPPERLPEPETLAPDRRLLQALAETRLPGEFRYGVFLQGVRLDLYCPEARLAVQLESPGRAPQTPLTEDTVRELENLGILLLLVPESRVERHLPEVVVAIRQACEKRIGRQPGRPERRKD